MQAINETPLSFLKQHLFELVFAMLFVVYGFYFVLVYEPSQFLTLVPAGFLNFALFVMYDNQSIGTVITVVIGFVLGWIGRKVWKSGSVGKIALISLLLINGLSFYYIFTNILID